MPPLIAAPSVVSPLRVDGRGVAPLGYRRFTPPGTRETSRRLDGSLLGPKAQRGRARARGGVVSRKPVALDIGNLAPLARRSLSTSPTRRILRVHRTLPNVDIPLASLVKNRIAGFGREGEDAALRAILPPRTSAGLHREAGLVCPYAGAV
jgi:hypothetical protein